MEKNAEKVWTNCLKIINDIVERQHYKTWFEPIKPVSLKNNVLVIQVPSQFFFEYLEEHYVNLLAKTLKRELGKDARLEYRIMVDSGNSRNKPKTIDVSGQGFKTFSNNFKASSKFSCKTSMLTVVNSADALTVKLQAIL